jgi:hypothetical protein
MFLNPSAFLNILDAVNYLISWDIKLMVCVRTLLIVIFPSNNLQTVSNICKFLWIKALKNSKRNMVLSKKFSKKKLPDKK